VNRLRDIAREGLCLVLLSAGSCVVVGLLLLGPDR
jgi:hypothetical protein